MLSGKIVYNTKKKVCTCLKGNIVILIEARCRQNWYQYVQNMYWLHNVLPLVEVLKLLEQCNILPVNKV